MSGSGARSVDPTTSTDRHPVSRRLPIGAEMVADRRAHFRVWAPPAQSIELVLNGSRRVALLREPGGYWSVDADAAAGDHYQFRIDRDDKLYPDPASRFQPEGPHGPSQIVVPAAYQWRDAGWTGASIRGQVI